MNSSSRGYIKPPLLTHVPDRTTTAVQFQVEGGPCVRQMVENYQKDHDVQMKMYDYAPRFSETLRIPGAAVTSADDKASERHMAASTVETQKPAMEHCCKYALCDLKETVEREVVQQIKNEVVQQIKTEVRETGSKQQTAIYGWLQDIMKVADCHSHCEKLRYIH